MPTTYQGVLFRNKGEAILNLTNPTGLSAAMQAKTITAITDLNRERHAAVRDPEGGDDLLGGCHHLVAERLFEALVLRASLSRQRAPEAGEGGVGHEGEHLQGVTPVAAMAGILTTMFGASRENSISPSV